MSKTLATIGPLQITAFHGGEKRGPCIQITQSSYDTGYAQLTRAGVRELIAVLDAWERKHAREERQAIPTGPSVVSCCSGSGCPVCVGGG